MLPRPEVNSFTRFVISLGVLLCFASVVVPALVLRETDVLRIPRAELARLTPLARQELERRQRVSRDLGEAAPYVACAALLLGLGLVAVGLPRMHEKERAEDERSSAELDKLRSEILPQTPEERQRGLEQDAADELLVREPPASRSPSPVAPRSDVGDGRHEYLRQARAIEARVLDQIESSATPAYVMKPKVKVGEGMSSLLLDGLLLSRDGRQPDVLVTIRYVTHSLQKNMRNRLHEAVAQVAIYRERVNRNAIGWLILVLDDATSEADGHFARVVAAELLHDVTVSTVHEREIGSLTLPTQALLRKLTPE